MINFWHCAFWVFFAFIIGLGVGFWLARITETSRL